MATVELEDELDVLGVARRPELVAALETVAVAIESTGLASAGAQISAAQAAVSASVAGAAKDATLLASSVYASTALGLAATAVDRYFSVPSAASAEYLILYQNQAGAAVEIKRYPSTAALDFSKASASGDSALIVRDESGEMLMVVTPAKVNHPDINAIRVQAANAAVAGQAVKASTSDKSLFVVVDEQKNLLMAVSPDEIRHPAIGRMNDASAESRRRIAGLTAPTTTVITALAEVLHFAIYGQSLSLGYNSKPALSTVPIPYALTFPPGVRPYDNSSDPTVIYSGLVPLYERTTAVDDGAITGGGGGQTIAYSAAQMVAQLLLEEDGVDLLGANQKLLFSASGQVGTQFAGINKDTPPYARLKNDITYGASVSAGVGLTYAALATLLLEGESDYAIGTTYAGFMSLSRQFRLDLEAHVKSLVGIERNMALISYQTSTHLKYSRATPDIALAQLALTDSDVDYHAMAAPTYFLPYYSDNVHLSNLGELILGAYFGVAMKRWFFDGVKPQPIKPLRTHRLNARNIVVEFSVPSGTPLTFDTERFNQAAKGFTLAAADGSAIAVASVALVGTNKVRITSATDIPVGAEWRYAWVGNANMGYGCVRDQQGASMIYDRGGRNIPLHNWLPICKGAI